VKRAAESDSPPLVLTGEGMIWLGATLLLGGLGWWKSINIVLLLAYLMFAALLINGLLARAHARRVTAVRDPMPPAFAGEEATVRVLATNTSSRTATVTVEDRAGDDAPTWLLHELPAGGAVSCLSRRTFSTRGRFPGPVRVSSGAPFGLLKYDHAGTGADVVVLPAAGVADPDGLRRWLVAQAGGDGRARKLLRRVTTDQADVRGVRPYRAGDSLRNVHWRSSARRGELMVREYDAAPAPDLVLVVEPWVPAVPTDRALADLEAALSLAVTIVRTWTRVYGTRVTVAVAGEPGSLRTTAATDVGVRDALAPLAEVRGGTTFEALGPTTFDRSLARAARVVVSSRRGSNHADALRRATGRGFIAICPADRPPWYQSPARPEPPAADPGTPPRT
jgi:uncharacterized protein (DUF58 family)